VRGFRRRAARSGVKVRPSLRALRHAPPLAAGVGTEPGFRWGARYENRAPAAPPAPQFRSELDISRTAAPSHTQVRTDCESDSRVFWGLPPKLHVRSQPPAVDGSWKSGTFTINNNNSSNSRVLALQFSKDFIKTPPVPALMGILDGGIRCVIISVFSRGAASSMERHFASAYAR